MDTELYNKLMEERPSQRPREWELFLEFCEMYLKKHRIKDPIVVELGVYENRQKKFWEQLLKARYIGIDISEKRGKPDILGDTHDPKTMRALKEKLGGKPIDILFIDADHAQEAVKKDFELYSPLCSGIVALHDTEIGRWGGRRSHQVWKFWDDLKTMVHRKENGYGSFLLFSIQHGQGPGLGVVMKK